MKLAPKTIMHPRLSRKFAVYLLICPFFPLLPTTALTPTEQADSFYSRGVAAEGRKESEIAAFCYELALRAQSGHRAARERLDEIQKKKADELLAQGIIAEAKGDLNGANLQYVLALQTSPRQADVGKKIEALKKKMGADFKEGGELLIREKMRRITIPRVDFEDTTLEEAIDFLRLRSRELDIASEPARKGINFVIRKAQADSADPGLLRIRELRLRNVPLDECLKYICDSTKLTYSVDSWAVTLGGPNERSPGALAFSVPSDFVFRLADSKIDPFEEPSRDSRYLRSKFEKLGISFSDDSSVILNEKNEVYLKGEADLLKRAEELMERLGGRPLEQNGTSNSAQPTVLPSVPVWISKDSKKVEAWFVGLEGETVVLRLADGKEPKVPLARLSAASVKQARSFADALKDVVLHYDFSDGNGTTVADRSGNGRHGTLVGFSNTGAGVGDTSLSGWMKDGSLRFDGRENRITTPLTVADLGTAAYTLEAIVSHTDPKGSWGPIIAVDAKDHRTPGAVDLGKAGSGGSWTSPPSALCSRHNGSSENGVISTRPTSICDGRLHHVAAVFDHEASEIRFYFDHLLLERRAIQDATSVDSQTRSNLHFLVGANGWGASERWFGPISEVRVIKRALSPEQFLPNPNPLTVKPPTPKHRWSFSGDLKDSLGGADGKVIDPGQQTARFSGGMLNLSGNRGEASASPLEDAFVDLPNGLVKGAGGRLTFEVWCTPSKWSSHANILRFERADVEGMAATERSGFYRAIGLQPRSFGNNLVGLVDVVSKGNYADAGFDLPEGKEHQFVLVFDPGNSLSGPSGTISLFLDGYLAATAPMPDRFLDDLEDNNNWLGRGSGTDPLFAGSYNEFRIYDKALSADDVLASLLAGPDATFGRIEK